MEKIVRDGMVAVAVSSGFGAGWSTWNDVDPMDARFNQLFLDEKFYEATALCDELGLGYSNGAYDVVIRWVPEGTKFRIDEYDGSESLVTEDQDPWRIA
jgi:hypothetical protein